MENRFGVKDFILFLLIGVVLVVMVLAMVQFDRQYREILTIKQQNNEMTRDMVGIKRQLAEGVTAIAPGPAASSGDRRSPTTSTTRAAARSPATKVDAFTHLREAEARPDFARGDWLIDNFATKIGRLTPFVSTDVYQTWVEFQVLEPMADRDPMTLEFVPRLATHWEISEDGLRMRFFLRRGVEFSDGDPLDADDVLFTFNWIKNPQVNADRARAYMEKIKEVKKIDSHTVEFTFSEFYYLNFGTVANSTVILPEHFYSRFTPDQFNEKTGLLMGSGQYKLENPETWTPGEPVLLVRNERYWGVPGTFDRIRFNELEGEAAEMVVYGNQEHDVIRCLPEQYRKLTGDPRVMAFSNPYEFTNMYGGFSYVGWNQVRKRDGKETPTFFGDKRVRQAMTMLVDRERIAREIWLGYATVATGPFAPKGPQSDPSIQAWPHDEGRAKALLAEAGFSDSDGDGVINGPNGKPFRFTLTYPSGNETTEKTVLLMKDNFSRAGIIMDPDRVDWPVLVQKLTVGDFDALTLAWSAVPESDAYQTFHSSQIAGQGDNRTSYRSAEVDRAIDQARTTVDTEERMKLWRQVHRILHEDQPYTFLLNRRALRLFNKRIQNIRPATIGLNHEYLNGGVIPWYVPKDQQKYTQ